VSTLSKSFLNDLKGNFGLTVGIAFVLQDAVDGGCGA
jgi:hypothetical protein